jgi:8-oxo-dGTP diphosphatase
MTSIGASDLVGQRIRKLRNDRGWTIRQLADRCGDLGAGDLSADAIANIETGRRHRATGRRRRDVTVDELLVLALALNAPPLLLLLPFNGWDHLKITPVVEVPTALALDWITGDEAPPQLPGGDIGGWMKAAHPILLYRQFRMAVSRVNQWLQSRGFDVPEGLQLEDSPFAGLADALNAMIGAGITPPPLPELWVLSMRPMLKDALRVPVLQPVVAAIVTSGEGVLITRRHDGRPPWGFITGEQRITERPGETAERECKEEAGLEVRTGEEIGRRVHPATGRSMIYLAATPVRSTKVFVGDEAELAEVRWASLAEALELMPDMFGPVRDYLAQQVS